MTGFFVTGTDTGVGKTLVSAALVQAYATQGLRAVGMKPVAAGCEPGALNEDVVALRAASNVDAPLELINPYSFGPAIAPHIAAQQADVRIDIDRILACHALLVRDADVVVVEGAGGLLVPLNDTETFADLAQRMNLPLILVVGMRLGCLNHALLTVAIIQQLDLQLAGWVANRIDPTMSSFEDNLTALISRIPAPLLGTIPFFASPENPITIKRFISLPEAR